MEEVIVKTEMQGNEEILLFYVNENGENEEGVLTTVQNIENESIQLQDDEYIIAEHVDEFHNTAPEYNEQSVTRDRWTEEETQRLLMFYNDNKQTFITGSTKRKHLWTVACKTMLFNKNPTSCDMKLRNMKAKYAELCKNSRQRMDMSAMLYDLCHQAFHDDSYVKSIMQTIVAEKEIQLSLTPKLNENVGVLKKLNTNKASDEKVEMMLHLYLKYKKNFQKEYFIRNLWDTIAMEVGEEDGVYWQKRFLNYKQHYICLLEKRQVGIMETNWPYIKLFDDIFKDDQDFCKKYPAISVKPLNETNPQILDEITWLETEKTVLVKYKYDCFDEFQDTKIPKNFLWNEIGRLLDKNPEACKKKYTELKTAHFEKYIEGDYDLRSRKPLDILFDNIISKEVELKIMNSEPKALEIWKTSDTDEIVQFLYDNIEMFKDQICYFVCWSIIGKKLGRSAVSCRQQWEELVTLYKSILDDKKEDPDMQIDWRYIELFDRIFDYGMDTSLLNGYEKLKEQQNDGDKIGVRKIKINMKEDNIANGMDDDFIDEKGLRSRTTGDSKAFRILEYYQKNKDKFSTTNRNKHNLWEVLAKQIGISATQCAHRFRNLKQVYTSYVQREISKPEMPIVWPYYALCKKVFGYRAIKSKLKSSKNDSDTEEWTAKEIRQLISYFSQNFDEISNNIEDTSKWAPLAANIDKTRSSCKDKLVELRKSYRKLKTQISRNPNVKISWKYFNTFEQIYNSKEDWSLQVMDVDEVNYDGKNEQDEDDYQCIIVIPDGTDISDIDNSQIMLQQTPQDDQEQTEEVNETKPAKNWTKRTKKRLLIFYINYIRSNKGRVIKRKEMWKEISSKLDKTPVSCRRMFAKLKNNYKQSVNDEKLMPYSSLLGKVVKLKPKFDKIDQNKTLEEGKTYEDVALPCEKVEKALQYYLEHIEDFVDPKFEKKYLWIELANFISEPVTKVFNKINYLLKVCNTDEISGENIQFVQILREITAKEVAINLIKDFSEPKVVQEYQERTWSDEEIEELLEWYLGNLEKFKNPKFVRSYLWMEASDILNRSPLDCSKKMSEVRSQYRNMVKECPEQLVSWRFYDLCQKIYGTGKKGNLVNN